MKRYLLTLLAFALLILPCAAWGATYYVAPTATGAKDGSAVNAAGTITDILNGVDFANGDVVILKAEVTYTTSITLAATIAGDGVTGLTIRGSQSTDGDWGDGTKDEDTSKPWISGNSVRPFYIDGGSSYKVANLTIQDIDISGQQFYTVAKSFMTFFDQINGLTLDNLYADGSVSLTTSPGHNCIYVRNLSGTSYIKNCTVKNYGPTGIDTAFTVGGADNVGIVAWGINDPTAIVYVQDNVVNHINSDGMQAYQCQGGTVYFLRNNVGDCGENTIDIKDSDNVFVSEHIGYRNDYAGDGCSQSNSDPQLIVVHSPNTGFASDNVEIKNSYFYGQTDEDSWAIRVASSRSLLTLTNIKVYNNFISGCWGGINQAYSGDNVYIFNNIVYNTPAGGRFFGYQLASTYPTPTGNGIWIAHNTAYSANNIGYGILGVRGNTTYVNIKNNVITCNYNGNVSLLTHQNDPKSTLDGNIWANLYAGDQTIITFGATSYTEAQQATWNAVTSVGTDTFGDPGFNNASSGQLWASGGAVAMVNNANVVDITATISEAAQGPISTSDWSTSTPDVNTIARADNTSADAGAYEYLEEDVWTECSLTKEIDTSTHTTGVGDTADHYYAGFQIVKAGGWSSVCRIDVKLTAVVGGDTIEDKTVYLELWDRNGNPLTGVGTELATVTGDDDWSATWVTFNISPPVDLPDTDGTYPQYLTLSMHATDETDYVAWVRGASTDADVGDVTTWTSGLTLGGTAAGYEFAVRIYTGNDVTPAAVTAIGVWNGTDTCEQNVTETYSTAQTITLCAELDKDVPVPPAQMGWTMTCGPEAGNTVSGTYMRVDAEGATTVLLADFALTAGMRITHPQTSEITGFETAQLTPTLSAGDVDGTGTITIAIPTDWLIGDEGNYATMTALKATFTILDGDDFTIGTVTEPGALDMSGDDCTELAPCRATLSGTWTQAGAGLTTGDWWEFYCEGNSIVGPVAFGANNVFNRCKMNE